MVINVALEFSNPLQYAAVSVGNRTENFLMNLEHKPWLLSLYGMFSTLKK